MLQPTIPPPTMTTLALLGRFDTKTPQTDWLKLASNNCLSSMSRRDISRTGRLGLGPELTKSGTYI